MSLDNYIYLLYNSDDKRTFSEKLALYNTYNSSNNNAISLIVEKILPASYIPFLHNNSDKNSENFIKEYEIKDDDYNVFYNKNICINKGDECLKNILKDNLNNSINNLDISKKCYNEFNIYNLIYVCIISWIIILCLILNIIYYYYKSIYTYILIIATTILLGIAVIFKMISTIQE